MFKDDYHTKLPGKMYAAVVILHMLKWLQLAVNNLATTISICVDKTTYSTKIVLPYKEVFMLVHIHVTNKSFYDNILNG
jgi:hypothetical protein